MSRPAPRFFCIIVILAAIFEPGVPEGGKLHAQPTWQKGEPVPPNGRANVFNLPQQELDEIIRRGRNHALHYPIEITGVMAPVNLLDNVFAFGQNTPFGNMIDQVFGSIAGFANYHELFDVIGLNRYPDAEGAGPYFTPLDELTEYDSHMGVSIVKYQGVSSLTFSCATCHSGSLFGKKIIGLTNRFPRSMEFFLRAKKITDNIPGFVLPVTGMSTIKESQIYNRSRKSLKFVDTRQPAQNGLDTSGAHIVLSMGRRAPDEFATRDMYWVRNPRNLEFKDVIADSKPSVWWNIKYKNRFLTDGSSVSGNPVIMALVWNELGRGTDLKDLEKWLDDNKKVVNEITAAVYASEPPLITDFFGLEKFDLAKAKRGEKLFQDNCSRCHGQYLKGWDKNDLNEQLISADQLKTVAVRYFQDTPVKDVGTDINRAYYVRAIDEINRYRVNKVNNVKIEITDGYVPPPLVGIWARWPYFHNNAVASLCDVLTPGPQRPTSYYQGPAVDPSRDFDFACNGYPKGEDVPESWIAKQNIYRSGGIGSGLSRLGHDEGIFLEDGQEIYTVAQKMDLIHYLQTL